MRSVRGSMAIRIDRGVSASVRRGRVGGGKHVAVNFPLTRKSGGGSFGKWTQVQGEQLIRVSPANLQFRGVVQPHLVEPTASHVHLFIWVIQVVCGR